MPVSVIDSDQGIGNIVTIAGNVSATDMLEIFTPHLKQPSEKFHQYLYSLIDLTGLEKAQVSGSFIRSVAGMCNTAANPNQISFDAIVVTKPWVYGFARMWAAYISRSGWQTKIFHDIDTAKQWLRECIKEQFDKDDLTFA